MSHRAVAYLKLRLGAAAADNALCAYRDRHRSSMMAHASESFALISRGGYSKLVTQSSGGSEILIANGADGSTKIASERSKGTRFQLYLALRVAGYHEFARAHAPPPFLADDIMETFDDFRAEEAFRLLAGMAGAGQSSTSPITGICVKSPSRSSRWSPSTTSTRIPLCPTRRNPPHDGLRRITEAGRSSGAGPKFGNQQSRTTWSSPSVASADRARILRNKDDVRRQRTDPSCDGLEAQFEIRTVLLVPLSATISLVDLSNVNEELSW